MEEEIQLQNEVFSLWLLTCSAGFPKLHDLQACVAAFPSMDYSRLLFYAAREGRADIVKVLLDATARPNTPVMARYPIMGAAQGGHSKVVQMLLDHGADPNVKDEEGITAMMLAACCGSTKVVSVLAKGGADLNAKNVQGGTAFLAASMLGKTSVVKMMLSLGVDPLVSDNKGQNALMLASFYGHLPVAEMLLQSTSLDVQARDVNGDTALIFAAQANRQHVTRLLLDHGALVSCKNKFNRSALDLARSEAIANLLREEGQELPTP